MSQPQLAEKVAIVTGAGNGIGRAIAMAFAGAGAAVMCLDIEAQPAQETAAAIEAAGGRARAGVADVSREDDTQCAAEATISTFGGIHILVNSAAANNPNGSVLETSLADWNHVFAISVTGAFLMSRAVLPAMIAGGGGSIIHIASQLGRVAAPRRASYCASKGAIIQLAKAMAVDHAADNIRVNALSPAAIETRRLVQRYGDIETARRESGPKHLLNRLGRPEEVAAAALFLASDESSFMTGTDMLVDGGYTAT